MAAAHGTVAHLLNPNYKADVARWLAEDCPSFDYGGFVVGETPTEARLLGKSAGILAGVPWFDEVFHQLDCTVEWHITEGTKIKPVTHCATVRGPVRKVLLGERVALNTLARCSGIATKTGDMLALLRTLTPAGKSPPSLAGTRKTTPGFRLPEKYAMLVGGADAHRHDLSAMTMLKDNHVWACGGSIAGAVRAAKAAGGFAVKVEVECQSTAEALEAIGAGADVVMLDNFSGQGVREAVAVLKERFGAGSGDADADAGAGKGQGEKANGLEGRGAGARSFLVEVSGGLTEVNVKDYVEAGVDVLSTSSIHQGVPHVDFSLKVAH